MPADPRLAALPALRKRAEEEAREAKDAWVAAIRAAGGTRFLVEETIATRDMLGVEQEATAHLTLLADLSRPASRDAVVRLVAAKARIKVYALHALLAGAIPYPPEWSTDLCDRVAAAESEAEALTLIAVSVLGGAT